MATAAGYSATVKVNGVSTAAVAEPCTALADDALGRKRYQITASARRILDRSVVPVVKGNAIVIAGSNIYGIDYLFGIITFAPAYVPTAPVTIGMNWLALLTAPGAFDVKLSRKNTVGDNTVYGQGDAQKRREVTQLDATVSVKGRGNLTDEIDHATIPNVTVGTLVDAGTPMLVQIDPDGLGTKVFRGWFMPSDAMQNVPIADLNSMDWTAQLAKQNVPGATPYFQQAGFAWGVP